MASLRTEITEIATGLGASGLGSIDEALADPPAALHHVDEPTWARLVAAHGARDHDHDFLAAWNNGRAFLAAEDGLGGRAPRRIDWTGAQRDPGDTVLPADLRIDHVYLVSCKYRSKVLHNVAPAALFDRQLRAGATTRGGTDWFDVVAPREHQELYQQVRRHHGAGLDLPEAVARLSKAQRGELRRRVPRDWGERCSDAYAALVGTVSVESARRWSAAMHSRRDREAMLWRLLRLGPAPYFVLGTGAGTSLRLRVDTPWDFASAHRLAALEVTPRVGGQPGVAWAAAVVERDAGREHVVEGHVEVRWSHGRFGGPPEAKVYLDTPHTRVPGYVPLS